MIIVAILYIDPKLKVNIVVINNSQKTTNFLIFSLKTLTKLLFAQNQKFMAVSSLFRMHGIFCTVIKVKGGFMHFSPEGIGMPSMQIISQEVECCRQSFNHVV